MATKVKGDVIKEGSIPLSALIYNLICRHDWYGIIRPISDWEIKYREEGDSGNPSLYFNIDDDLIFEIDIYGTVTEL